MYDGELDIATLNRALLNWERVYDTFRPHHSLDGRTPAQYLEQCHTSLVPAHSVSYVLNEYSMVTMMEIAVYNASEPKSLNPMACVLRAWKEVVLITW